MAADLVHLVIELADRLRDHLPLRHCKPVQDTAIVLGRPGNPGRTSPAAHRPSAPPDTPDHLPAHPAALPPWSGTNGPTRTAARDGTGYSAGSLASSQAVADRDRPRVSPISGESTCSSPAPCPARPRWRRPGRPVPSPPPTSPASSRPGGSDDQRGQLRDPGSGRRCPAGLGAFGHDDVRIGGALAVAVQR
jgi:hypothetical protein